MKKAVLVLAIGLLAVPCAARTITVDANGTGDYPTIQAAIDDANNGDTVEIQPGTYTSPGNRDIDYLGKAITVCSIDPNDPNIVATTIIDCNGTEANPHRGFYFHSGAEADSVISGLTITNGYATYGGGIYCENSGPTIRNCVVHGNACVNHGGGIYGTGGQIIECTISNNHAGGDGGGLYRCDGSIHYCTISNNSATLGGGGLRYCSGNISSCAIIGNSTSGWAGGLYNCNGTIKDCIISNNSADFVGGLHYCSGPIINCTISHNSTADAADRYGGGLANCGGPISDCNITDNRAGYTGGGLYSCHNTITNCTITGNSAKYGGGIYSAKGSIIGCTIADNTAELYGGGLRYCYGTISDCLILRNTAGLTGGGLESCSASITSCIIAYNAANSSSGGGGGLKGCSGPITNCAVVHNSARDDGGGLEWCAGNITNCTVAFNSAGGRCGGLYQCGPLTNCIVYHNTAVDEYNNLYRTGPVTYSCIQDASFDSGCITSDPMLAQDGYHLKPGSPCINAGRPDSDYSTQTDIDREARVMGGVVDMGADEFTCEPLLLVGLDIMGPEEIRAGYSAQYIIVASYEDGSTRYVTLSTILSLDPESHGIIGHSGLLVAAATDIPQDTTIHAQYAEGDVTLQTARTIHIYVMPYLFIVPDQYETIQAAIDAASNGDMVIVADGLYRGSGNRDIDFMGKPITVQSENGPQDCIIDCNGTRSDAHSGFYFHSSEDARSIVDGFTITNGYGKKLPGGGIYCAHSSPTIRNCIITDNTNTYTNRGGAGIACVNSGAAIIDCTITYNTTPEQGGGVYCADSDLKIHNCVITDNISYGLSSGDGGGGVFCTYSTATITGCNISQNVAEYRGSGGGVYLYHSSASLNDCTIGGNLAQDSGGGIYSTGGTFVMTNCILWGNSPCEIDGGGAVAFCDIQGGYPGTGNIDADPYFADPNHGDYHLKSQAGRWDPDSQTWVIDDVTSPCIDAGDPMSPIGQEPFPNGGIINMGAYGGTSEASKSYFDKPPCEVIIAGDINGDCNINFKDYYFIALHWLRDYAP